MKYCAMKRLTGGLLGLALCAACAWPAFGNGGPFVVKYPDGDPAAKGVLARLDPDLKPVREERLKVIEEDLSISFVQERDVRHNSDGTPLVNVAAEYRIKNPSDEEVEIDFGFPILRGIYISPFSMMPRPDVTVTADGKHLPAQIISNSAIYGIIRRRARGTIEEAIEADKALRGFVEAVESASDIERDKAREELREHLTSALKWNVRDAALMVEYVSLDLGKTGIGVAGREWFWERDEELSKLTTENLGDLGAIGEKKATQLLAHLSGLFDPGAEAGYEKIFAAWGGDVRERSVDLETGEVRPREITLSKDAKTTKDLAASSSAATIYARVDYLESNGNLSEREKEACKTILKNLPVIFTFAPMNLIHYRVRFAPGAEQKVTVSYSQYAYRDTRGSESYQFSYVVHPASLWDEFGPINLTVKAPAGAAFRASVPCKDTGREQRDIVVRDKKDSRKEKVDYATHSAVVTEKTGELFLGIDAEGWRTAMKVENHERSVKTVRR